VGVPTRFPQEETVTAMKSPSETKKPERGGGTPSCAQRWGAGHRTQDPSRDRGWGLDPSGWGVSAYPRNGRLEKISKISSSYPLSAGRGATLFSSGGFWKLVWCGEKRRG